VGPLVGEGQNSYETITTRRKRNGSGHRRKNWLKGGDGASSIAAPAAGNRGSATGLVKLLRLQGGDGREVDSNRGNKGSG